MLVLLMVGSSGEFLVTALLLLQNQSFYSRENNPALHRITVVKRHSVPKPWNAALPDSTSSAPVA